MTNRQKEEKLVESLKDPTENHSKEISKLINDTIKKKHKVYLCTDFHLWKRKKKNKPECDRNKNYEEILKNVNSTMTDDDLLIYLGDFVDGEYQDKESLKDILLSIPGKKVMCLGNNDLFGPAFYKSCGIDHCVQSFVWNDILFCHIPAKNDNQMNIHGHIHSNEYTPTYWVPYTNQIDVAWCGGREKPVELKEVISKQKAFSKVAKEDPSHFEEGYYIKQDNIFDTIMESYIPDPFE